MSDGPPPLIAALLRLREETGGVDLPIPPRSGTAGGVDLGGPGLDPIDEGDANTTTTRDDGRFPRP